MFVLLIGLPRPRPRTTVLARVVSVHKTFVVRQYFTPAHARALTSKGDMGVGWERGYGRAKVAGSTRSPRSSRRLPQVHPFGELQFPFTFARARSLARNGRNIVRLCLHLIRRRTGYTEPCLWPVSHVRPAVRVIAVCVNSDILSSTHGRAPRIFAIKNAWSF